MAIKGKSKKRGGGRTRATLAPKPVVAERKPPLLARPKVKRTILALLVLAVVLGGLRVWQNLHRSNALEAYNAKLRRATGLLSQHLDASTLTSMPKNSADLATGKIAAKQFLTLAKQWETDLNQVKTEVTKLKGPEQLGDAQALVLQGIDGFIRAARLYQVAAQQQQIADDAAAAAKAEKDKTFKAVLDKRAKADKDQVQVLILHADEARTGAQAIYDLGGARIRALSESWSVTPSGGAASSAPITVPGS